MWIDNRLLPGKVGPGVFSVCAKENIHMRWVPGGALKGNHNFRLAFIVSFGHGDVLQVGLPVFIQFAFGDQLIEELGCFLQRLQMRESVTVLTSMAESQGCR